MPRTLQVARTAQGQSNTNTFDIRPLQIVLFDDFVEPLADIRYRFTAPGVDVTGTTDSEGTARAVLPRNLKSVFLEFWPQPDEPGNSTQWELEIGELEPASTQAGLAARLDALGFHSGDTEGAIRTFQDFAGLPVTGQVDESTREAIEKLYGDPA